MPYEMNGESDPSLKSEYQRARQSVLTHMRSLAAMLWVRTLDRKTGI